MYFLFAQTTGFEAISAGEGLSIAATGMLIVFFALVIISLFIRLLPIVLDMLEPILPRLESHAHSSGVAASGVAAPSVAEQLPIDKEKIVAAIGFVLHLEMEKAARSS